MSRIGKKPIKIADKVEVKVIGDKVQVKGPKGQLEAMINKLVKVEIVAASKEVHVVMSQQTKAANTQWGTARTIISNMIVGASTGFTKTLEFNGVGYKAVVNGRVLTLNLGHSHPIEYKIPEGVQIVVTKNVIEISGASKELLGFVAAKIRDMRPPEPYKGKGVKYLEEVIIRKAGKASAKK